MIAEENVLATGKSALYENSNEFCLNLGAEWIKENPYKPDYFRPLEKIKEYG